MKNKHHNNPLARKVELLKQACPMTRLLIKLGLGRHAKASCSSPFRSDANPSWGIFKRGGSYYFKDLATGESGDEITLIAMLKKWDTVKDFRKIVEFYEKVSKQTDPINTQPTPEVAEREKLTKPDVTGFQQGTEDQLQRLSTLRSISVQALKLASERGFLIFGQFNGLEVFGIKDSSGNLAELRRLDGKLFPQHGPLQPRKSHTIRGSMKSWPVGIVESADHPSIVLVEGLPDFLACFDLIIRENQLGWVAPVSMLTSSCSIDADTVQLFRGKRVRIFPHADQAGIDAAVRWYRQLTTVASNIDFFQSGLFEGVKDLCDLNVLMVEYPSVCNREVLS